MKSNSRTDLTRKRKPENGGGGGGDAGPAAKQGTNAAGVRFVATQDNDVVPPLTYADLVHELTRVRTEYKKLNEEHGHLDARHVLVVNECAKLRKEKEEMEEKFPSADSGNLQKERDKRKKLEKEVARLREERNFFHNEYIEAKAKCDAMMVDVGEIEKITGRIKAGNVKNSPKPAAGGGGGGGGGGASASGRRLFDLSPLPRPAATAAAAPSGAAAAAAAAPAPAEERPFSC